jgi:diguanylate cyclase (GGDEF)-like protein/PAS domain S-box-containing protein
LIFYKDTRSVYLGSNKAFAENYLGMKPENFIGKTDFDINPDKAQAEFFRRRDKAAIHAGTPQSNDETLKMADGRIIDVETIKTPFYSENGKLAGLIGISRDITARRHADEKLRRSEIALKAAKEELECKNKSLTAAYDQLQIIAATDQMTKLLNRWSVLKLIEQEQMRFKRCRRPFSVIIADIDAFKAINDTYGHNYGDHVIITVSEILRSSVRAQDRAARWGGEEFLIFLPETHLDGATVLAEKLRSLVAEYVFEKDGLSARATMTFGISVYEEEQALDQLIGKADKALYAGKAKGKNTVVSQTDIT